MTHHRPARQDAALGGVDQLGVRAAGVAAARVVAAVIAPALLAGTALAYALAGRGSRAVAELPRSFPRPRTCDRDKELDVGLDDGANPIAPCALPRSPGSQGTGSPIAAPAR